MRPRPASSPSTRARQMDAMVTVKVAMRPSGTNARISRNGCGRKIGSATVRAMAPKKAIFQAAIVSRSPGMRELSFRCMARFGSAIGLPFIFTMAWMGSVIGNLVQPLVDELGQSSVLLDDVQAPVD